MTESDIVGYGLWVDTMAGIESVSRGGGGVVPKLEIQRQGLTRTCPLGRFDGVCTYVADHTLGKQ